MTRRRVDPDSVELRAAGVAADRAFLDKLAADLEANADTLHAAMTGLPQSLESTPLRIALERAYTGTFAASVGVQLHRELIDAAFPNPSTED